MAKVKKLPNLSDLVDRLGRVKADIADLAAQEKEIVDELKARGTDTYKGALFEANVFSQNRSTTSWKDVCAEAKVPQPIINKHTTSKYILVCTVTARK